MKLFLQNVMDSDLLVTAFKKKITVTSKFEQADVILTEWVPKDTINLIKSNLQKNKIFIIFDRYLSISIDDANWLKQKNVILLEPAINFRRKHFNYLPFWVKIKKIDDIKLNEFNRHYDLVYKGDLQGKLQSFNKYYTSYTKEWPETVYIENQKNIISKDIKLITVNSILYQESKATLIIGTPLDYEIGYLDYNFFKALENNCIPLIINEHKYFTSLTEKIEIPFDINYIISNYDKAYIGDILYTYERIEKYYPEMVVENVVEQILNYVR